MLLCYVTLLDGQDIFLAGGKLFCFFVIPFLFLLDTNYLIPPNHAILLHLLQTSFIIYTHNAFLNFLSFSYFSFPPFWGLTTTTTLLAPRLKQKRAGRRRAASKDTCISRLEKWDKISFFSLFLTFSCFFLSLKCVGSLYCTVHTLFNV